MSDHVPIVELADAAAGLLDAVRRSAVDEHLAHCEQCSQARAELGEVTMLLAAEPTPQMPGEVATRLSAVVQAESDRRISGAAAREEEASKRAAAKRQTVGTFGDNRPLGAKESHRQQRSTAN